MSVCVHVRVCMGVSVYVREREREMGSKCKNYFQASFRTKLKKMSSGANPINVRILIECYLRCDYTSGKKNKNYKYNRCVYES